MDFKWLEKDELWNKYKVFGSFYNIKLNENKIIQCRNDLRIYDKSYFEEHSINENPQLLVIMMNPGNSLPLDKQYEIPCYTQGEAINEIPKTPNVETVPDATQYQIMRIMYNMGYNYVKVINISDLRNPLSNNFLREIKEINQLHPIHSLFYKDRETELLRIFTNLDDKSIILKAWGISAVNQCSVFKQLVKNCLESLPNNQPHLGLQGETFYHFRHPLPFPPWNKKKQLKWLQGISKHF
ncbi:hypothetical protein AT261_09850 [Bacillus cereus]|uniref:hypothetical protein n=1 Tax=Bacillus TaxID=1386 RepID=UPI00077A4799|nr:hypothetical protein [Bacillus cereus]KXY56922.1 hypothetical protein AT261_09850 [Bacillus cereus]PEX18051.1 hypothetical protein CN452_22635 [Bacillus cereus]HDR8066711.1 hypothetical protein [Bacillus cereus]